VDFINDSKGTNVNSTWYALESVNRPIVWIAGGVDKGNDYTSLLPLAQERVKALVALGKDNRRIEEAFSETISNIVSTQDMVEAVRLAMQLAEKGDVVLLSPACASFDLFDNFEHRGLAFKDAVKSL
jgi:UDP-N-acetylmuramoylalanine--D-glutamate ligase